MGIRKSFMLACVGFAWLGGALAWVVLAVSAPTHKLSPAPVVVLVLACFGALAAMTGYWLAQSIRRRLYDIEEAAALMASGRLAHRVETWGKTDEIGSLASGFNRMGDQIERQVSLLQSLADENQQLTAEAERGAAVEERQRLARELHDSVSQQLFALTMLTASAQKQFAAGDAALADTLSQAESLANAAQREMRGLLLHLRPIDLAGRSLAEGAAAFLDAVSERHRLRCEFQCELAQPLGAGVEEQLFRILQEAVANALKHAEATAVQVRLWADGYAVFLSVLDNGIGIDVDAKAATTADTYGLHAMRERARLIGGRCDIWRRAKGTAVQVQVPLLARDEEGQL